MSEPSFQRSVWGLRGVALLTVLRAAGVRRPIPETVRYTVAAAVGVLISLYFWQLEGGYPDAFFATAVTLTIAAATVLVCRRIMIAAALVAGLVATIRVVSAAKQQASEVLLHAHDAVTLLAAWQTWPALWTDHRRVVLGTIAVLLATAAAILIAARFDLTRVARPHAAAALAILAAVTWIADATRGERRHTEFYFESNYVTFFYASWSEMARALWQGQLIDAVPARLVAPAARALDPARNCAPPAQPPHIILIHQESVVPPALFPKLNYDHALDPFFQSLGGKVNKLRVETFGGASWLTEFSVLAGLSTQSFGSMRQSIQQVMAGKIGDMLPQALARCGYRNVMFYPMLRHFLGSGRFFEAAGITEIVDAKAQGAKLPNERDRFYYSNALTEIGRHVGASTGPLFVYIQTMAAHGPYDYAYSPEVPAAGGGPGTHPEVSEYLRRLAMTSMDYAYLRAELARRFPRQRFLIMHYGDHQPTAAQSLLGFGDDASIEDVLASGNEAARLSYYALDAIGYRPPPLPSVETLDVAYLGTVLLEAAGLPLSDSYRERRRLMMLCRGRYHDCPARDEILLFHRRLIDSGLMKAL